MSSNNGIIAFVKVTEVVDITSSPVGQTIFVLREATVLYPYLHAMTSISTVNIGDAAYSMP